MPGSRFGRGRFLVWFVAAILIAGSAPVLTTIYLREFASLLAGTGWNASFAQNIVIIAFGWLAVTMLVAAGWRRLKDAGEPAIPFAMAAIAIAILATLNGPIFIRPYLPLPPLAEQSLWFVGLGIVLFGIVVCLTFPSVQPSRRAP